MKIIHFFPLFEISVKYLIKSQLYGIFLIILEYLPVFITIKNSVSIIFPRTSSVPLLYTEYISPIYYIMKVSSCVEKSIDDICTTENIVFGVIISFVLCFLIFIWGYLCLHSTKKNKIKRNTCLRILNYIIPNSCELITRIFGIFIIYICLFQIITGVELIFLYNNSNFLSFFRMIISLCTLVLFSQFYLKLITNVNIMIILKESLTFRYDWFFSVKFDLFLFYIKFIISITNILDETPRFHQLRTFFCSLHLLIQCGFFFYILFRNSHGKFLFLLNKNLNLTRIFMICSSCLMIPFYVIFDNEMSNTLYQIFYLIAILIVSLLILKKVQISNDKTIYRDQSLIYFLVFFINIKNTNGTNIEELNSIINEMKVYHSKDCNNKCCLICVSDSSSTLNKITKELRLKPSIEKINQFILSVMKQIKKNFKNFTKKKKKKMIMYLYPILKIIINNTQSNKKNFKIIFGLKKLIVVIQRYPSLRYFLKVYFDLLNKPHLEATKKFSIINKYYKTIELVKDSLMLLENLFIAVESEVTLSQNLHSLTENFIGNKKTIFKYLNKLNSYKDNYVNENQLLVMDLVYKFTYNLELSALEYYNGSVLELDNLKEKFISCKTDAEGIQIKVNIEKNTFIINKIGLEFKEYGNKNLEDLFHPLIKIESKNKLLNKLMKSNTREFETLILIKNKKFKNTNTSRDLFNYIRLLKLNCKCLPSLGFDEIILLGKYEIISKNLMLFKHNEDNKEKYLCLFSEEIPNILLFNPLYFEKLFYRNFFSFSDIFEDSGDQINQYKINYNKIFINLNELLNKIGIEDVGFPEQDDNYEKLQFYSESEITLTVKIENLLELSNKFYLYSLNIVNKTENPNHTVYDKSMFHHKIKSSDVDVYIELNNTDGTFITSEASGIFKGEQYNYKKSTKNNPERINRNLYRDKLKIVTFIFLIFDALIILVSLVFLIILSDKNTTLDKYNSAKFRFVSFRNYFHHLTIYSFMYVFIFPENSKDINAYDNHFTNYMARFQNASRIYLSKYLQYEYHFSTDFLQNRSLYLKSTLDSVGILERIDSTEEYFELAPNSFSLVKKNYTFFQAGDIFMNKIRTINAITTTNSYIYLFNYFPNGTATFPHRYDNNISIVQKIQYESVINYIPSLNHFIKIEQRLNNFYTNYLTEMNNNIIYLTITVWISHFLIIALAIMMMKIFKANIKHLNRIVQKISIQKIKANLTKIRTLGTLIELSMNNNRKLFKKISNFYSHNSKNKSSKSTKDVSEGTNRILRFNIKIVLNKIFVYLVLIFAFYYAFNGIVFLIYSLSYHAFNNSLEFFDLYTNLEIKTINSIIMTKVMILSNQTDYDFSLQLPPTSSLKDSNYLRSQFSHLNTLVKKLEIYCSQKKYSSLAQNYKSMNCDYIYNQLNDKLIQNILLSASQDEKDALKNTTTAMCKGFEHMNYNGNNTFVSLLYDIIYDGKVILNEYEYGRNSYAKSKKTYDSFTLIDLTLQYVLIIRPINSFIKGQIITNIVNESGQYYNNVIIACLILNVVTEIFLFILINKIINKKILQFNDYMSQFMNAIQI